MMTSLSCLNRANARERSPVLEVSSVDGSRPDLMAFLNGVVPNTPDCCGTLTGLGPGMAVCATRTTKCHSSQPDVV